MDNVNFKTEDNKTEKLCYNMKELATLFPIGKNNLYNMVHQENFPKIVIGKRIMVPKSGLEKWLLETATRA